MAKPSGRKRSGRKEAAPWFALLGFVVRVLTALLRKKPAPGDTPPKKPRAKAKAKSGTKARKREGAGAGAGTGAATRPARAPKPRRREHAITALQRAGAEGHWTRGEGVVFRCLPDDLEGSRHQRFLVRLSDGHVIKLSHNIDLARRVPAREGDRLSFAGDFESNELGGALHWTHLDPRNWHPNGWIDHAGKRYE